MFSTSITVLAVSAIIAIPAASSAWAADSFTITIPRRSELTPVQRLNRDGVQAIRKHQYEKAEALFLKAYLYDPADPFTLNNLGYISELQGELDRANRFYELASEQACDADIDQSNVRDLKGKPMKFAFENLHEIPMRVNRMNVVAMDLLEQGRGFQAIALLEKALRLDPQNPFTLNNMGVAEEAVGDYASALKYYTAAAESQSSEPVVVTMDRSWRGKSVSHMAEASAKRLEKRLRQSNPQIEQAILFNRRGVFEANENNWSAAKQDFLRAYSVDPSGAFSLNNRGYVAEKDGDIESAQFFYEKAQRADGSQARVGLATRRSAEGKDLLAISTDSNRKVDVELDQYSQERRRQNGPIELTPRGNALSGNSEQNHSQNSPSAAPQSTAPRQ